MKFSPFGDTTYGSVGNNSTLQGLLNGSSGGSSSGLSGNGSTVLPSDLTGAYGGYSNLMSDALQSLFPQATGQLGNILSGDYMDMSKNPYASQFLESSKQLGQNTLNEQQAATREQYGMLGLGLSQPLQTAEAKSNTDFATQMANLSANTGMGIYNQGFQALQNAIPYASNTMPQSLLTNLSNLYNQQYQAATDPIKWGLNYQSSMPVSGATVITNPQQYPYTGGGGGAQTMNTSGGGVGSTASGFNNQSSGSGSGSNAGGGGGAVGTMPSGWSFNPQGTNYGGGVGNAAGGGGWGNSAASGGLNVGQIMGGNSYYAPAQQANYTANALGGSWATPSFGW